MKVTRPSAFLLGIVAAFLVPLVIPNVGIDYPYFFIFGITLAAWFTIKWGNVRSLPARGKLWEMVLGFAIIGADYGENFFFKSSVGLIDLIVIFAGLVLAFYGLQSFRLFWVPAAYGIVLLLGYQLENIIPNYVALQDWLAGIMASSLQVLGINATLSGQLVALNTTSGPLLLDVQSDCTGIQGVLAFGMLSTMAVLDVKKEMKKLVPLLLIGFGGAFLINILRLFVVFLTFEFLGVGLGTAVHAYLGYMLFIGWVMVFWMLSFRYLTPAPMQNLSPLTPEVKPLY